MLLDVQFQELAVLAVRVAVGIVGVRVLGVVLLLRQQLLGAALLELAHGRARVLREREELLGDLELAHVVAADLGDDVRFFVAVVGLEAGHGGTCAAAGRAARVVATRAHKNVCERRAAAASCACDGSSHACVRARLQRSSACQRIMGIDVATSVFVARAAATCEQYSN